MQERKVVVSRFLVASRLFPKQKKSVKERAEEFVAAQREVSAYPFSPGVSVKSLYGVKSVAADNKEKRKKAKSKMRRIGAGIYDPNAKQKPGQYFQPFPLPFNKDGQMGDVANMGWMDPPKAMDPKTLADDYKKYLISKRDATKPIIGIRTVKKNARTGAYEQKALGRTIGRTLGNIGQAAARAVGIVIDGDGRFRCPPGVPAANQFTDEVGSNCFDFSPLVARKLIEIAQRTGQQLRQNLDKIDSSAPTERLSSGGRVMTGRAGAVYAYLKSGGRMPDDTPGKLIILGPDGKPISAEILDEAEDIKKAKKRAKELRRAEKDVADAMASAEPIDPARYEDVFEEEFRRQLPRATSSEIKKLAQLAAQRARAQDEIYRQQNVVFEMIEREFPDFKLDRSSAYSINTGLAALMSRLQEKGLNTDFSELFGEGFRSGASEKEIIDSIKEHQSEILGMSIFSIINKIRKKQIEGIIPRNIDDPKEEEKLKEELKRLGINVNFLTIEPELKRKIRKGIDSGATPGEVFPDSELLRNIYRAVAQTNTQALTYESGHLISIARMFEEEPTAVREISKVFLSVSKDNNATMGVNREGRLEYSISVGKMMAENTVLSFDDGPSKFVGVVGGGGTEVAKLQEIAKVVSAEAKKELIDKYFGELHKFADVIAKYEEDSTGLGQLEEIARFFGNLAFGQFVSSHEVVHGRQYLIVAAILKNQFGLTNEEAFSRVFEAMTSGYTDEFGRVHSFAALMNPKYIRNAIENYPEILRIMIDSNTGGGYPMDHFWATWALRSLIESKDKRKTIKELERMMLFNDDGTPRNKDSSIHQGLSKILKMYSDDDLDIENNSQLTELMEREAATTILELQADIGAAVSMGLIPMTPEIEAFLSPLVDDSIGPEGRKNILKDMGDLAKRIMPRVEEDEKAAKKLRWRKLVIEAAEEADVWFARGQKIGEKIFRSGRDSDSDILKSGLSSTAMYSGRRQASRWGGALRNYVLETATDEQKKVLESDWRKKQWAKPTSTQLASFNLSMDTDGSETVAMLDKEIIPFADLVEKSKLPNGVAVEIIVPAGSVGMPGDDIGGARFELSRHFTAVIKTDEDLGLVGISDGPASKYVGEEQRVIINVPEGFSGLPDFTPGTDKGEVGSMILPPGEIEIVGRLSDGSVVAMAVSQSNALDSLAPFEASLRQIIQSNSESDIQKLNAQKALNRIENRRNVSRVMAARLASGREKTNEQRDVTVVPKEIAPNTRRIKERMSAQGIRFGKALRDVTDKLREASLEERRTRPSSFIVEGDKFAFERPEEAKIRVNKAIDNAIEQIKVGKFPGLSPEVAEIMKDKSREQIRTILVDTIKKQIKGMDKRPRFRIRGAPFPGIEDSRRSPLMGFLKTGKWMTTYEVQGDSQAASAPEQRKKMDLLLGIPEKTDNSLRPAHGFFLHVDELEFIERAKKERAMNIKIQYPDEEVDLNALQPTPGAGLRGNIFEGKIVDSVSAEYGYSEIILKPETSQRSVLTFGDSYSGMRTPVGFDGTETDDELLEAAILHRGDALVATSGFSSDTQQLRIASLIEASVSRNHAHVTHPSENLGSSMFGGGGNRYYTEAIVAGSFNMSDVEEIRIDEEFQERSMRVRPIKPSEVDSRVIKNAFDGYITKSDADKIAEIIKNADGKYSTKLVTELREDLAYRANLVEELKQRQAIRQMVADAMNRQVQQRFGVMQELPKITFVSNNGKPSSSSSLPSLNPVHSDFPMTMKAGGLSEEHELLDVVRYGSVALLRGMLANEKIEVAQAAEFEALKPQMASQKLGSPTRFSSNATKVAKREPSRLQRQIAVEMQGMLTKAEPSSMPSFVNIGKVAK